MAQTPIAPGTPLDASLRGEDRPEDRTRRGWGVVIDSIEIQDVRVLSGSVFANLQARYRNEQERFAKEAELRAQRELVLAKLEA